MDMHVNFISVNVIRDYTYLNYCALKAARSSFSSHYCITVVTCTACLVGNLGFLTVDLINRIQCTVYPKTTIYVTGR